MLLKSFQKTASRSTDYKNMKNKHTASGYLASLRLCLRCPLCGAAKAQVKQGYIKFLELLTKAGPP